MNTIRLKQAGAGLALIAATATVLLGVRMVGRTEPVEAGAPPAELVERLALALDAALPASAPAPVERRRIDLGEARMIVARATSVAPDETADDLAAAARVALSSAPVAAPVPAREPVAPEAAQEVAGDPAAQRFAGGLGAEVEPPAFRLAEREIGGMAATDWVPASGSAPATLELRPVPRP